MDESAIKATQGTRPSNQDVNPFAQTESSHPFNHASVSHSQFQNNHHLKLNLLSFDREDPMVWIYKSEQYFEFKERIALRWHRWFMKFRGPVSWTEFTMALLLLFGPTDYEDPFEALTRLKQTSTVTIYQEAFEKL
ncbi:hypothetical protein ACOSQ2_006407 [Xanthoceras sorbifolium]